MRVWGILNKNHKIIASTTAASEQEETGQALLECLEQIYKSLDIAEPVWVSKHARSFLLFAKQNSWLRILSSRFPLIFLKLKFCPRIHRIFIFGQTISERS